MTEPILKTVSLNDVKALDRDAFDPKTMQVAAEIVADVRKRGEEALREHGLRLGDLTEDQPLYYDRNQLEVALETLDDESRLLLERTAQRIASFAYAQRECLADFTVTLPGGGTAGHEVVPVERAGCYAPGGRFPLPSSVLMTAVTARAAGVKTVWVASPKPTQVTLAAASVAGADALLAVGGAQAIAALAFGAGDVPSCDAVVGPGNRYVTAAKQLVAGHVAIDMLAGPSELVVVADDQADAELAAADLLAQAEHDPDALPVLIAFSQAKIDAVNSEIQKQLAVLSTADTAREAIKNGFAVLAKNKEEAIEASDRLAPEHLQLLVSDPDSWEGGFQHYGALFSGAGCGEVLGDYGAGPNHVLPTGGTARSIGGLSVFNFLRIRTKLRIDKRSDAQDVARDAAALARLEGLAGHARAAELRQS
ncbi:MAG: histidinol dehydrogenase [Planctomycetota bacterium]|nr:histidinol dehydrogenase [Planctomycetota bacterium]